MGQGLRSLYGTCPVASLRWESFRFKCLRFRDPVHLRWIPRSVGGDTIPNLVGFWTWTITLAHGATSERLRFVGVGPLVHVLRLLSAPGTHPRIASSRRRSPRRAAVRPHHRRVAHRRAARQSLADRVRHVLPILGEVS